jgi:hypothetical protein
MTDYNNIIKDLLKARADIDLALKAVIGLQAQQDLEVEDMGRDYWKEFEGNTGTLRSTINDLDKLTGGEISRWQK